MFLTTATIEELQHLELSQLIDLLATQTSYYIQLKDGTPVQINALKEYILQIQTAIEIKKRTSENNASAQTREPPAQNITQLQSE